MTAAALKRAAIAACLLSPVQGAVVAASSLTSVSVEAPLYDERLSADGGCDPAGCNAGLTRDGDTTTADSRWSCKPALGVDGAGCTITYNLADSKTIASLDIAMYEGDERTRTIDIYVDDVKATTWTSSGSTTTFENIKLGIVGQAIELRGVLGESEWLSITEVEIFVDDGSDDDDGEGDSVVFDDASIADMARVHGSGDDDAIAVEAGTVGVVTTTASLFDPRLGTENGCDPDGCTAALTRDGDVSEDSRWSCASSLGGTCSISYDLGDIRDLFELRLALYRGATRARTVEVHVDGVLIITWTSSGNVDGYEAIDLYGYSGQYLTVMSLVGDTEWISIVEAEIMVLPEDRDELSTPPVAATVAPAPANAEPVSPPSPTPTGSLQTVGLTPLARGGWSAADRFAAKDGDLSTSWTCTGDPTEPDDGGDIYYECELSFGLVYYRNIKQVKIGKRGTGHLPAALVPSPLVFSLLGAFASAPTLSTAALSANLFPRLPPASAWKPSTALADGDQQSVDMRIATGQDLVETFVTSSGTTTELEAYDFDFTTSTVEISAVFSEPGQSISISEVEFVEEVTEGQVLIDNFNTPYEDEEGLWSRLAVPGYAWASEHSIGQSISFSLAGYFTVTEAQLQFPEGDTYKFDLQLFNDLDGTGEAYVTIGDLESADQEGWQSFDLTSYATETVTSIALALKGTGSGTPDFTLLDANFLGEAAVVPQDTFYVGSTRIEYWPGDGYPDFVAQGTGDQQAINAAICAVKKGTYDGSDCIGMDETATGTVELADDGYYMVDGSVVMQSGVFLAGYFNQDGGIHTYIALEEKASGNPEIEAIIVMDGVTDAWVNEIFITGTYDPETDDGTSSELGPACLSVTNSRNVTASFVDVRYCDGDAMVVRNSDIVNIDAGRFDDELLAWSNGPSKGTGLIVDTCDSVWVRRHRFYDNGVAGLHITGSNNFTFEATYDSWEDNSSKGSVGSLDGQQPIEIIIESSSLVAFTDMNVLSVNDPVMTISGSTAVSFSNPVLSNVPPGTCVIQTDDPSTVTINAEEDELSLQGTCYVKV